MSVLIESLGVYLPKRIKTNDEIKGGCKNPEGLPIEMLTGIRARHFSGRGEYSIDLARKAVQRCFLNSKYSPQDIDLIICANISRFDAPNKFYFEPSTSVRLQGLFDLSNSMAIDISNACAGMFTAIKIAEVFMKTSGIGRALVVSGEYITHLTKSAQKEIQGWHDCRFACLTLGDSGVAVILERSRNPDEGFLDIDLFTLGEFSSLCIAKANPSSNGGTIMYADSIEMARSGIGPTVTNAVEILMKNELAPDQVDFLIPHQTSLISIGQARKALNKLLGAHQYGDEQIVTNLDRRGNTSTNSHFVALYDHIRTGRIRDGQKILFSITASGLTIGSAIYSMDNLPSRLKGGIRAGKPAVAEAKNGSFPSVPAAGRSVIESVGLHHPAGGAGAEGLESLRMACEQCLDGFDGNKDDIGMVIFCGVYRNEFVMEPAIATFLVDALHLKRASSSSGKILAFDIFNGAHGFLNSCFTASSFLRAGKMKYALIAAAEVENNRQEQPRRLLGIYTGSSAVLLRAPEGNTKRGFDQFFFRNFPQFHSAYTTFGAWNKKGTCRLVIRKDDALTDHYLACIAETVDRYLKKNGTAIGEYDWILPPQISAEFTERLCRALRVDKEKVITARPSDLDLFSSSIAFSFHELNRSRQVRPGDRALVISVGSGIQVGCATYRF